jgi:hypothetical protein
MTSAALVAGLLLASSALAADPPPGGGGGHGGVGGHGGGMPPRGFHGVPSGFQGALPHGGGPAPGAPHYAVGRPGHDLGAFNGRGFSRFTPQDRSAWQGGAWRHTYHNGYNGWWWVVGDNWFFYPGPIYPYPEYVGPDYYYDYYNYYPTPSNYWYYCEDPPGYYPNVQDCNVPWQPVPPAY